MQPAALLALIFLSLFALGHALRLAKRTPITINKREVPLGISVLAFVVAGALAVWLYLEQTAA